MAVNKPTWQLFTPAWHRTALERRSIVFIGSSMSAATAGLVPFWRLASHQRPRLAFQKDLLALPTEFTGRPIYF